MIDLKLPIEELNLTVRPLNVLKRSGIKTIEDLCKKTEMELQKVRNMGRHSLEEIIEALDEHGLHLKCVGVAYGKWTPITDGLPPVGVPLIVTIKDNLEHKPDELRYPVYYEKDHIQQGYSWNWRYGDFNYQLIPSVSEVVAYMELPEPYKKEGAESEL